jgi:2-dehydro-3-deoxyphosphogluconate aldolase / (4S)-4-hydroxy-2-oxoglutarate aldolase
MDISSEEHAAIVGQLRAAGVVATLRAHSAQAAMNAVSALVKGGITAIEVTYSTPDVPAVLRALRTEFGDQVLLGAGTITRAGQAAEAVAAGARFLVSPGCVDAIVTEMTRTGVLTCAGAFTPTEVMRARALGADVIKIFPANLAGPRLLKALLGPFPDLLAMPTGGISTANLGDWLAAGALAVGASGELCSQAAIARGDWGQIQQNAKLFTDALAQSQQAQAGLARAE